MAALLWLSVLIASTVPGITILLPFVIRQIGYLAGLYVRRNARSQKELLLERVSRERNTGDRNARSSKEDDDWEKIEGSTAAIDAELKGKDWSGIIGFFHPFCNAGGGGERVLWAAIRATQKRWPNALCVVYTGDQGAAKAAILRRVEERFDIRLDPPTVQFIYLSKRRYVLDTTWPHFTLLGQSLGSLVLAWEAFNMLTPDIFIDTMGYAFTLALSKWLFPNVPTAAYVHYPTISTDMLGSLDEGGQGLNAGAGQGLRGYAKRKYWHLFAALYSWVGGGVDVVMTNSSWTQGHIRSLWGPGRTNRKRQSPISVVYPPVAVEKLERQIDVNPSSEKQRGRYLLYIAQFRPEKNHQLILHAFANLLNSQPWTASEKPQLILLGSVRDDDSKRVYKLRLLVEELKIKSSVEFVIDASWPQMLDWLRRSWVGVNGMWNEHFGIGVVEYQAAGLIGVVNDSGGPKLDIVVDDDAEGGQPTGFRASTVEQYAEAFARALALGEGTLPMRLRARRSARRFDDAVFEAAWVRHVEVLVALAGRKQSKPS